MAAKNAAGAIKARLIAFAAESYDVAAGPDRVPRQPRVHRQPARCRSPSWSSRPISRASRCPRPASTRRRRSTGIAQDRAGPAVLLFRLWGGVLRGAGRHHDRRDEGRRAPTSSTTSGRSLNPAVDIGQIEGGFVQGMGWLTTEELVFHADGRLLTPRALDLQDPVRVGCAGALQDRAVGRRQPRGHDLSLQGGRRAAADAGDLGVRGDRRRDPQPQARRARAARCAGDAGGDPARRAGGEAAEATSDADLADHRALRRRATAAPRW